MEERPDLPPKNEELKKRSEEERHTFTKEAKELIETLLLKEKLYITRFKIEHKILFAFVIFFAINLVWYGMWEIVSEIPILNNPFVALITGAIILIGAGYLYENLISTDFNKELMRRAKKNTDKPSKTK